MNEEIKCAWKSLEGCLCPEAEQQLQTAKEENEKLIIADSILNVENQKQYEKIQDLKKENEKLKNQNKLFKGTIKKFNLDWYEERLISLTQQNKQMRKALEKIVDIKNSEQIFYSSCDLDDCFDIAQQALNKGVK